MIIHGDATKIACGVRDKMTNLFAQGKLLFVYIDEALHKMWWLMPDFETVRLFKTGKENWVEIPPEVQELLETIEAEYKPKIEALQEKLKLAESGVKQLALDLEMTLRGNVVMAVYRKGSTKWDEKHLERLAAEYPRILEAKVEGKPSVAIQRIK